MSRDTDREESRCLKNISGQMFEINTQSAAAGGSPGPLPVALSMMRFSGAGEVRVLTSGSRDRWYLPMITAEMHAPGFAAVRR
jgi:hypothetical protein